MKRRVIYGIVPDGNPGVRRRAAECAAFAASCGQRLSLVTESDFRRGRISSDSPADGIFVFISENDPADELIRELRKTCPGADIRRLLPATDEKETVTTMIAHWPSRRAIDRLT